MLDVLLSAEIVRVTALIGNSSFLDQDGLEHGSPLSSGTLMNNGGSGDLNGWGDVSYLSLLLWNRFVTYCFTIIFLS